MVHDSFSASRHDPGIKCFSVCLFLYLSVFYIFSYLSVCVISLFSVYLFVSLSACLFVCWSIPLFIDFSVYLSFLFFCLFIVCWSLGSFLFFLSVCYLVGLYTLLDINIFDDTFHHSDRNPNVHIFAINPVQKTSMDWHLCESHQQNTHQFRLIWQLDQCIQNRVQLDQGLWFDLIEAHLFVCLSFVYFHICLFVLFSLCFLFICLSVYLFFWLSVGL